MCPATLPVMRTEASEAVHATFWSTSCLFDHPPLTLKRACSIIGEVLRWQAELLKYQ